MTQAVCMYRDGEKHIFNEAFLYILLFHFPVNLGSRMTSKGVRLSPMVHVRVSPMV